MSERGIPMAVSAGKTIRKTDSGGGAGDKRGGPDGIMEAGLQETLLKARALQSAIFNSANFSCIAIVAKGCIPIFNVGAERMRGSAPSDVITKIPPADISDQQKLI